MDLGCYVLSAARHFGRWIGGVPELTDLEVTMKEPPELDAAMLVQLAYPGGVTGKASWDMNAADRTMTWTVVGSDASATSPAFAVPHLDNRLLVTRNGSTTAKAFGDQTSYTYQLAALATALADGTPFLVDMNDSVANAELIDESLRRVGLHPRGLG
jgi:predicted dehydrogenase